jgi:flagellin
MAAILSTNMASLYAQKNLSTAQSSLSESVQRLSSGTRINSAKDDAAGYGIAESVRGTKNIIDASIRNAKDGISWAQTAEGALDVVGNILQRVLTLTTQSTNVTYNADQRKALGENIKFLSEEISRISARTKFQGGTGSTSLFDTTGAANVLAVTTGAGAGAGMTTSVTAKIIAVTELNAIALKLTGVTADPAATPPVVGVASAAAVPADILKVEVLVAENIANRNALGSAISSLEYAVDNMETLSINLSDSISRIVDTDYAAETSNLTRTQILQQAATSMLAQANQMPNVILTLLK